MKNTVWALLPLLTVAAAFALSASHMAATPTTTPAPADEGRVPVVVELFTSEGCSSCPSADAVLRELESTQSVPGVEVLALGEHVDYWNRLGWRDPFSAAQFSERQRNYATHFTEGSYTPQAVVNGRYELVGSRRQELSQRIAEAARMPHATVTLVPVGTSNVTVQVSNLPAGTQAAQVALALTETGLSTQVGRGENAGRLLQHAAVVRSLRPLGPVAANGTFSATVPLTIAANWKTDHLRAVALVQEAATGHVVGAASLPLATALN